MKKIFGLLLISFGILVALGSVSATTTEQLQPAQTVTYTEPVVINSTLNVSNPGYFPQGVHIGSTAAGVGGVTYFNGTITNASVDSSGNDTIPVTFSDNVRIDGKIYRTEEGGDNHLKIADTLLPAVNNTYSLGVSGTTWKDLYVTTIYGGSAQITGALTIGGGYGTSGTTIDADGNINLDGNLTVDSAVTSGSITAGGDINQNIAYGGAIKAMIYVPSDGDCTVASSRQWTYNDSTITCVASATGTYTLSFDFQVNNRYWQVTPVTENNARHGSIYPDVSDDQNLTIYTHETTAGTLTDTAFILTVY